MLSLLLKRIRRHTPRTSELGPADRRHDAEIRYRADPLPRIRYY